jgi:hypothetical protein
MKIKVPFIVVVSLAFLFLLVSADFSQESNLPKVSVSELPPEPIPVGTCKKSYSGYLEVDEHGNAKDTNLTSKQIGNYVKQRLSEGYSLSLYPQASGRLFVIETCAAKN